MAFVYWATAARSRASAASVRAWRRPPAKMGWVSARPRFQIPAGPVKRLESAALSLPAEGIFAQAQRLAGERHLLIERAQREVGLRHLRSEREAHGVARRLARLELGTGRAGAGAQAPEDVDLVGNVDRGAVVLVLGRYAGKKGCGALRVPLPGGEAAGVERREESRLGLADQRACLVDARGGDRQVGVVLQRLSHDRIQLRILVDAPPAPVFRIARRALFPGRRQLEGGLVVDLLRRARRQEGRQQKNESTHGACRARRANARFLP